MTIREKILTHMRSHSYRPMRTRRLARFFDIAEDEYVEFRDLVKRLIREGEIAVGPRGKLVPPPAPGEGPAAPAEGNPAGPAPAKKAGPRGSFQGRFSKAARGFGFVIPADAAGPTKGEDLFIPANETLDAVTGDTVLAQLTRKTDRGFSGRVLEVVERGQTRFVGTYYEGPAGSFVRPDGGVLLQDFAAPDARSAGAKPKDKVVFEVLKYALRDEPGEAVITEVLGRRGDPGVDTLAVIRAFGLPDEFSEEALAEARGAADRMDDATLQGRRDLAAETVITIDPDEARDYDDAISLSDSGDGTATLGVHIADVSHFVPEGSVLDREARERGTSVYLPTTVIPMLPEVLSNGACSLQEGRVRLTKSAFIRFDAEGEPVEVNLANSFIKSARRLTYRQATAALDGKPDGLAPEILDLLQRMDALARRLLARRRRLGYLELDLPDVELEFDDQGRVVAAHPEDTSFSHKIIEMFMVEANEAVARELAERGVPFIRRIHPEPDNEAAEDLKHFAKSIGYPLGDPSNPLVLQRLLNDVRGKPEAYGIHLAVLRSLKRAEYSPKPEGHFALASDAYCHFTSPIRRYPDLTVHRLFDDAVRSNAPAQSNAQRRRSRGREGAQAPAQSGPLVELAKHCSMTEQRAEAAERELTKIKLLEFLESRIGDVYTGVITGVQAFGMFVEIPNLLVDGLVHISNLTDDTYTFDRKRWALVGRRHGRALRVGTEFDVRIAGVDIPKRQLDLAPVDAERARAPSAPAVERAAKPHPAAKPPHPAKPKHKSHAPHRGGKRKHR